MLQKTKSFIYLSLILALLIFKAQSQCGTGQFSPSGGGPCQPCDITCKQCNAGGPTDCTLCVATRFLTASNACQCNDGYQQQSPIAANCVVLICDYTCSSCNTTANNCLSCKSNTFRTLIFNACPCIDKYYDNGNSSCAPCHYSCATCSGGNTSSNCLSCDSLSYRAVVSGGVCNCLNGYFDDGSHQLCSACKYYCGTCVTSSTNCLTCGLNRSPPPSCPCSATHVYDDPSTQTCLSCQYSCLTCTNFSACVTCDATKYRTLTTLSPYCICKDRYYNTGTTQLCSSCDPTCLTCNSIPTNCTSCYTLSYRNLTGSACVCQNGYYQTSSSVQMCSACNFRCKTCSISSTNCTSCSATYFRTTDGNGNCPCNTGYYEGTYGLCTLCQSSCYSCSNGTACTGCYSGTFKIVSASTGLCQCPNTMYLNTTNNICQPCYYQCLSCNQTSPILCLSCDSSRTFSNYSCPCLPYYYDDGSSISCQPCYYACATCNGIASTNCLTCSSSNYRSLISGSCLCNTGYYDDLSQVLCQPCIYNCLTCTNSSQCATCDNTVNRIMSGTLCVCITKYYQSSNKICTSCNYTCMTCSSGSTCDACDASKYRQINTTTALCSCMNHYFDNGIDQTCYACFPQCLTCINVGSCSSCNSSLFRYLTSTYRCNCITRYWDNSGTCTPCLYKCLTCSSSTTCITCNSTAQRQLNSTTNLCDCKTGYLDNGITELCFVCSYACKQCSTTATTCTLCDTSVRTLSGSQWCDCHQHFYDNNSTMVCPACQYSCDTCTNFTQCATCNASKFRIFDVSHKYCDCQIKYYSDLSTQLCHACNYACMACTNSTKCLTCDSSKFRQTPSSMCPCILGYYDDTLSHQLCAICDHSCLSCTNGTECANCDLVNAFRSYNSSTKLCSCITNYFDDGINQVCNTCAYSCATCLTTSGNCLTCNSTAHRSIVGTTCPCKAKFYDGNLAQLCLACQYTCATCSDGISCDTCNAAKFRQDNTTTNLCSCMIGYYDDSVNELCPQCDLTCLTCINSFTCSSCDSSRMRTLNSSANYAGNVNLKCPCIYKYYSPASNQNCLPCHYSCAVCSGGNNNNCLYCTADAHRTLSLAVSKCNCVNGYYDDGLNELCASCNVACTICSGSLTTQCTACNGSTYLLLAQTTCYITCPTYFYNNIPTMTCASCPSNCNTCINSTNCTNCDSPYYLYLGDCLVTCPDGSYPNATSLTCISCPTGCSLCTSNVVCSACIPHYYFDSLINLCFSCNDYCNECLGPGQGQCTSCYQPLYFRNNKCFNLTCPYSQYVDSSLGCQNCSSLFSNSLTCNKTQAFLCVQLYKVVNKQCVYCSQVIGYHITKIGTCSQICGDGILFQYQCDDGNTISGDGCSQNCMIESGWSCDTTIQPTTCTLQQTLIMKLQNIKKYSGQNRVNIQLSLNIEYRLTNGFSISIVGVDISLYQWNFNQGVNLSQIFLDITYQVPLDNKQITISYTQARRFLKQQSMFLSNNRLLLTVSFSTNFNINAYPPANYYSDERVNFYKKAQQIIFVTSLLLVIGCLFIIPTKMHLHTLTLITILPQIYLVFGVTITSQTDWINFALRKLSLFSLIQGVSFGQCCFQMSSYLDYDTEIVKNQGLALSIWILFWIVYGVFALYDKFCAPIRQKLQNLNYFILTIHLMFFYNITYSSFNSLYHYSIQNQADAFNTTLGITLVILTGVKLALTWSLTWYVKLPKSEQNNGSIKCKQDIQALSNDSKFDKDGVLQIESQTQNKKQSRLEKGLVQSIDQIIDLQDAKQNDQNFNFNKNMKTKTKIRNLQNQTQQSLQNNIQNRNSNEEISSLRNINQNKSVLSSVHSQSSFWIQEAKSLSISQKFLNYDYLSLYKYSKYSKLFLPVLITKLYLSALIAVFVQSVTFYCVSILGCVEFIYLMYLVSARPFASTFTNFRLIIISLLFLSMYGIVSYYLYFAQSSIYIQTCEYIFIILCAVTLLLSLAFCILQHIKAWKKQLYEFIQPCLIYFRLKTSQKHRVFDAKKIKRKNKQKIVVQKIISQKEHKIEEEESYDIDVFYQRMLKKQKANKKYRRQRMMKESIYHPY